MVISNYSVIYTPQEYIEDKNYKTLLVNDILQMKSKRVKIEYYSCVGHQGNIPTFAVASSLTQISFKIVKILQQLSLDQSLNSPCTLYV